MPRDLRRYRTLRSGCHTCRAPWVCTLARRQIRLQPQASGGSPRNRLPNAEPDNASASTSKHQECTKRMRYHGQRPTCCAPRTHIILQQRSTRTCWRTTTNRRYHAAAGSASPPILMSQPKTTVPKTWSRRRRTILHAIYPHLTRTNTNSMRSRRRQPYSQII